MLEGVMGIYGFRVFVLVVSSEEGNLFYKDYVGNFRVFGAMYRCIGTYNV